MKSPRDESISAHR